MISLALDTSGSICAACIYDSERKTMLGKMSQDIGKGHAEHLMEIISGAMGAANIDHENLDRIIACIGPGSFTGIRVGVATARGFGLGLKIPVVGISSLDTLIVTAKQKSGEGNFGAVQTAGRGDVYCQFSFDTEFAQADVPIVMPLEHLKISPALKKTNLILCGSGAKDLSEISDAKIADIDGTPSIETIALLGSAVDYTGTRPEPLYLRKPDAKPQLGFAVARQDT